MPFYEYQCEACGAHHEAMRKISDPPLRKCPACGKPRLTRLLSAPVFRLKGGGWYETDFKTDQEGRRNLAGDERKPDATAEQKAGGPGEAQPAAAEGGKAGAPSESKSESKPDGAPVSKAAAESKPAVPAAAGGGRRNVRRAAPAKPARKPPARGTRGRR